MPFFEIKNTFFLKRRYIYIAVHTQKCSTKILNSWLLLIKCQTRITKNWQKSQKITLKSKNKPWSRKIDSIAKPLVNWTKINKNWHSKRPKGTLKIPKCSLNRSLNFPKFDTLLKNYFKIILDKNHQRS